MPPATALLLHGFTSGPASMWRFQEWLAELGYQAEARAQLGHGGRGPAADYSLAALAADNLAMGDHDLVVGHSMGGATATLAAARRQAWAGRLVLVDPAWRFSTAQEAAAVKQEELAALDRDAGEIRAAYSAWDERDGAAKIQEVARVWRPAVEGIIDANLDADLRDAARSLAVPTLVICGDPAAGGAVTHADGDAVASANPNVRLARIAGTGHNPHRDDPQAVRRALLGRPGQVPGCGGPARPADRTEPAGDAGPAGGPVRRRRGAPARSSPDHAADRRLVGLARSRAALSSRPWPRVTGTSRCARPGRHSGLTGCARRKNAERR